MLIRRSAHTKTVKTVELSSKLARSEIFKMRRDGSNWNIYTNLLRSVRPRDASSGFQRSPTFAILSRTLSRRKSSMRTPRATSVHSSGVETVASGVGRTE